MQKRSSKQASKDVNQIAARILSEASGEAVERTVPEDKAKNPAAVALGRLGGKVGVRRARRGLPPTAHRDRAEGSAGALVYWQT